jgi:hypothetical protein
MGLLSLLAVEIGFKTVIYSDIYDISCRDAEIIATTIGNKAKHYICGDTDTVLDFFNDNDIKLNAIVSTDVIEHIYDIKSYLTCLRNFSGDDLSIAMSTGANPLNLRVGKAIMREHIKIEYSDREKKYGQKERDSLYSFFKMRRNIIIDYLNYKEILMDRQTIDELALKTRGLIEDDIIRHLDTYLNSGKFTYEPDHPTNTCDPYTGNWAEHLMDPYSLKHILEKSGFLSYVIPKKYELSVLWKNGMKETTKNIIRYLINVSVDMFNDNTKLKILPGYIIAGYRSPNPKQA